MGTALTAGRGLGTSACTRALTSLSCHCIFRNPQAVLSGQAQKAPGLPWAAVWSGAWPRTLYLTRHTGTPAGDRASPGKPGGTASALPAGLVQDVCVRAASTPPPTTAQVRPRPPGSHGSTSLTPQGDGHARSHPRGQLGSPRAWWGSRNGSICRHLGCRVGGRGLKGSPGVTRSCHFSLTSSAPSLPAHPQGRLQPAVPPAQPL